MGSLPQLKIEECPRDEGEYHVSGPNSTEWESSCCFHLWLGLFELEVLHGSFGCIPCEQFRVPLRARLAPDEIEDARLPMEADIELSSSLLECLCPVSYQVPKVRYPNLPLLSRRRQCTS